MPNMVTVRDVSWRVALVEFGLLGPFDTTLVADKLAGMLRAKGLSLTFQTPRGCYGKLRESGPSGHVKMVRYVGEKSVTDVTEKSR